MGSKYLKKDRLADVLALIQVLALDEKPHRSEKGLEDELQGAPRSAKSWKDLGKEHPEFFRVRVDKKCPVSLVARHVTPESEEQRNLDNGFIQTLLGIVVDMHDREANRHDHAFRILLAVLGGFAGGMLPFLASWTFRAHP